MILCNDGVTLLLHILCACFINAVARFEELLNVHVVSVNVDSLVVQRLSGRFLVVCWEDTLYNIETFAYRAQG